MWAVQMEKGLCVECLKPFILKLGTKSGCILRRICNTSMNESESPGRIYLPLTYQSYWRIHSSRCRMSCLEGFDSDIPLTYFEMMTAVAIQYFVHEKIDVVILEVGLGSV